MADIIIGIVLLVVVGIAIAYIVKGKKRGVKCIGCPSAGTCQKRNCGCQSDMKQGCYKKSKESAEISGKKSLHFFDANLLKKMVDRKTK